MSAVPRGLPIERFRLRTHATKMKRVAQVALCASLVLFASVACSKSEREVCNALPFEIYQDDVGPDGTGTATVRMVPRDVNLPGFIAWRLASDRSIRAGDK